MNLALSLLLHFRYLILFPLVALEGPIATLVAGFLVSINILDFFPTIIIVYLGDFIPDSILYFTGRLGSYQKLVDKYKNSRTKIISSGLTTIARLWGAHPRKTMLFAKITYGVAMPFLISAGLIKMPYSKFISYSIPVTLLQCTVVFAIGYYLGQSFVLAQKYISYWIPLISLVVILLFMLYFVIARLFKKEFIEFEEEEHII